MSSSLTADDMKLLYFLIKLAPGKANMADVATALNIKHTTTYGRLNSVMKKIETTCPEVTAFVPAVVAPNAASPATPKRKRTPKKAQPAGGPAIKNETLEAIAEEGDVEETPTKRVKTEAKKAEGTESGEAQESEE